MTGWDSWMASPTQWTWVWISSFKGSWWWTKNPGVLQSMGSQRVGHDWATELNWSKFENKFSCLPCCNHHSFCVKAAIGMNYLKFLNQLLISLFNVPSNSYPLGFLGTSCNPEGKEYVVWRDIIIIFTLVGKIIFTLQKWTY